jgi:hypothetical protein
MLQPIIIVHAVADQPTLQCLDITEGPIAWLQVGLGEQTAEFGERTFKSLMDAVNKDVSQQHEAACIQPLFLATTVWHHLDQT